jgi:hypothetical protein
METLAYTNAIDLGHFFINYITFRNVENFPPKKPSKKTKL